MNVQSKPPTIHIASIPSSRERTHFKETELNLSPSTGDFFTRNGFSRLTKEECDAYACRRFPSSAIRPTSSQGYCSYSLAMSDSHILQFRPDIFKLDMDICRDAKEVFGQLAPETRYLGAMKGISETLTGCPSVWLHVYLQDRVPGVNLASYRQTLPAEHSSKHRRRLVEDMAHVFAAGYHQRRPSHRIRSKGTEAGVKRKIGDSLGWRLDMLQSLPGKRLASHVADVRRNVEAIEQLPWCLTHGDLVPSNVLVDAETGRLTGLVDWAEGEWLPLGIGLYGLEELLGHETAAPGHGFEYFGNHEELRQVFWSRLLTLCRDVNGLGTELRLKEVQMARKLGIMLWRGIAFDDGRIDRVVQAGRDDVELYKLRLFLEAPSGIEERSPGLEVSWGWLVRMLSVGLGMWK